ncbi:sugar phosphate nucleotidyltransferase [Rossellomorea marisflavi]|uniref:sugar phosphate nucleotidyltransferase n=1 Tax=Rossellomorea marisflavi TaxID=189381 RepID=UPI00285327DF|nr:sugar phosphate nucleotidyltransferase [Rossellomorea marisflavi]MDR4935813.1 sugar phosphate nucleotidyltransferase [Rossellomorea marisflavi]
MKNTLLGVIDATSYYDSLGDLLLHRSLAALPIAGRYRLVDFVLSNMVNSDIGSVAIFPKYQYRSLMDHLGSGKNWDLNRKRDGLFFFPVPGLERNDETIGSFNHFAHHIDYFTRSTQEYALITNSYTVCNISYRPVLERHVQIGCDITEIRHGGSSLHMYLVKKSLLVDLIKTRHQTGYTCMNDVVEDMESGLKVCGYEHQGFVERIDSIDKYFETSMNLLELDQWRELFKKDLPIYTKVKDEPPTRYTSEAGVKHSIIANGCFIKGHVDHSMIFRAVKVGECTTIKNSIIMQKSQIGRDCVLENVILDKDVKIEDGVRLIGDPEQPIVVRKGMVQGALMNS